MLKLAIHKPDIYEYGPLKDELVRKMALAMIGLNDPLTASHMTDVAALVHKIATKMKLDRQTIQNVTLAGYLHDIGKHAIPNSYLTKPSPLTAEEFAIVRTHVDIGVRLLENAEVSPDIIQIVSQHHERIDGSGYPKGLKGDEISIGGQIIGIADVTSAMTSKRTYRQAASKKEVTKILLASDPATFDPEIAKVALSCL